MSPEDNPLEAAPIENLEDALTRLNDYAVVEEVGAEVRNFFEKLNVFIFDTPNEHVVNNLIDNYLIVARSAQNLAARYEANRGLHGLLHQSNPADLTATPSNEILRFTGSKIPNHVIDGMDAGNDYVIRRWSTASATLLISKDSDVVSNENRLRLYRRLLETPFDQDEDFVTNTIQAMRNVLPSIFEDTSLVNETRDRLAEISDIAARANSTRIQEEIRHWETRYAELYEATTDRQPPPPPPPGRKLN